MAALDGPLAQGEHAQANNQTGLPRWHRLGEFGQLVDSHTSRPFAGAFHHKLTAFQPDVAISYWGQPAVASTIDLFSAVVLCHASEFSRPPMLAKIYSAAVYGVDAYEVEIEVNGARGDPKIIIVGLPDAAVKESRDRVTTAISNSGYFWPRGRTTINLAPADIKKEGPSFDLPIALGMIAVSEELDGATFEKFSFVGELALNGAVRPVKGVLPVALEARRQRKEAIFVPAANAHEAAMVEGIDRLWRSESPADFRVHPRRIADRADSRRSHILFREPQRLRSRFQRRERAGPREARHRSRRRGRAQPAHDRPARLREVDALETDRHHHAADVARGSDREHEDPQHFRDAQRRTGFRLHAPVPLTAPHHFRRRFAWRLRHSSAG